MIDLKWARQVLILPVLAGLLAGCTPDPPPLGGPSGVDLPDPDNANMAGQINTPAPNADALPDFSLTDVNANSARFGEAVSPREYLGQVSAWYFGHAT